MGLYGIAYLSLTLYKQSTQRFGRNTNTTDEAYLRFIVVDCPDPHILVDTYEHRFAVLLQNTPSTNTIIVSCKSFIYHPSNIELFDL